MREVKEVAVVKVDDGIVDEDTNIVHDTTGGLILTVSCELVDGVAIILDGEKVEAGEVALSTGDVGMREGVQAGLGWGREGTIDEGGLAVGHDLNEVTGVGD